jgi:DNA-binding transcriptional LysR family regulator
MTQRCDKTSIPTEILRSVIRISELHSISKAARSLGFSQPTLSLQIKRIESMVGGSIFQRTANGSVATELGEQVLRHARKIIETNDQLLSLRGFSNNRMSVRLGISNFYIAESLKIISRAHAASSTIYTDEPAEITKALLEGFIDIALFPQVPYAALDQSLHILRECDEPLHWVRSRDFTLSPGEPIPLLTRSGSLSDDLMVRALESKSMIYRIAVNGADYHSKLEAVRAGMGFTALPARLIPPDLVQAREYYLPKLEVPRLILCARDNARVHNSELVKELIAGFFTDKDVAESDQVISITKAINSHRAI